MERSAGSKHILIRDFFVWSDRKEPKAANPALSTDVDLMARETVWLKGFDLRLYDARGTAATSNCIFS